MQVTAVVRVLLLLCADHCCYLQVAVLFAGCCCYLQVAAVICRPFCFICRLLLLLSAGYFCCTCRLLLLYADYFCYPQVISVGIYRLLLLYADSFSYLQVVSVVYTGDYYCCYMQVPAVVCRLLLFSAGYFCYMQVPAVICRPPRLSSVLFCYAYVCRLLRYMQVYLGCAQVTNNTPAAVTYRSSLVPEHLIGQPKLLPTSRALGVL